MNRRYIAFAFFVGMALVGSAWSEAGEATVGWRGDGSGQYPSADPPLHWGRVSKTVKGLHFQAAKPKDSDTGAPMADGVIREWLVLGPVALPEGAKIDDDTLPNETQLSPAENEKAGEATWKKIHASTDWLNFATLIGKPDKSVAYACSHVFSETGGTFRMNLTQIGGVRVILNGKVIKGNNRIKLDLVKGWNTLLLKCVPAATGAQAVWASAVTLHAYAPAEYENTNIAWMTSLPGVMGGFYGGGMGCGAPIVVNDKIYLLSEPFDLICLNKSDGKILWVKSNSYFDAAIDSDKASPSYKEAEVLAGKLSVINASFSAGPVAPAKLDEKTKLETDIQLKMRGVDVDRYKLPERSDVGYSGFTPVSDGQNIYIWLGTGVSACYDLQGNRKWIRVDNLPNFEHGVSSSPILVDGKLVVFMRDLIAIDAKTGKTAWQIPLISRDGANPNGYFHGTPLALNIGGVAAIALGNGTILRASDGKAVFTNPGMGKAAIASPVLEKGMLIQTSSWGMQCFIHKLPAAFADPLTLETQSLSVDTPTYPHFYLPWYMASPVVHEGLAYLVNNAGVLTVVDINAAKVVYQELLDLDHFQGPNDGAGRGIGVSPTLAGKYLYFFGNNGASLVVEPGRVFKQIAKNKLENVVAIGHWAERQERFIANPVFDGKRVYVRGEGTLFAIGQ